MSLGGVQKKKSMRRIDTFQQKLIEKQESHFKISKKEFNVNKINKRNIDDLAKEAAEDFSQSQFLKSSKQKESSARLGSAISKRGPEDNEGVLQKVKIKKRITKVLPSGARKSTIETGGGSFFQKISSVANPTTPNRTGNVNGIPTARLAYTSQTTRNEGKNSLKRGGSVSIPQQPIDKSKLLKQGLHNCSNADTCELATDLCATRLPLVSEQSNNIKRNNMELLNDLDQLRRADRKQTMGSEDPSHDFQEYEIKKKFVNKELIKLQQQMKQIVTTKKDRYIDINYHIWTKVVVVEETRTLLKLDLLGAESPVTFTCELLDNTKADLEMYLSTVHLEPSEFKN